MKIIATNLGKPKEIVYKNKKVTTGIFKFPVNVPIFLDAEKVKMMLFAIPNGMGEFCKLSMHIQRNTMIFLNQISQNWIGNLAYLEKISLWMI